MLDVSTYTSHCVAETTVRPRQDTKSVYDSSDCLASKGLVTSGHEVLNLTIGDFDPKQYPI